MRVVMSVAICALGGWCVFDVCVRDISSLSTLRPSVLTSFNCAFRVSICPDCALLKVCLRWVFAFEAGGVFIRNEVCVCLTFCPSPRGIWTRVLARPHGFENI